ncbi:MAG: DUF2177 family protein [Minisyncoccia bacterium]
MSHLLSLFASAFVLFAAIDIFFITYVVTPLYRSKVPEILADKFAIVPALAFYFIYIFGIVYFAILPALKSGSWMTAFINGALLGVFAYATFTLTNMAILKNWPFVIAASDIVWGALLTGTVAALVVWFFK